MKIKTPTSAASVTQTALNTQTTPKSGSALILGGGSMKGAFQAGACMALFESGFRPEKLYGISVGGLNGTFLTHEAARQYAETGTIDWVAAGKKLIEYWLRYITRPEDVAVLRSRVRMGFNTLMSRFDGLFDNAPIKSLIRQHMDAERLKNSPISMTVGAVDVAGGDMCYFNNRDDNFLEYVIASSSLPFLMPAVQVAPDTGRYFLDGGLREVAPIRLAIEEGAQTLACVACHARKIYTESFNPHNLIHLMDRVKDITVNQLVNNDIAWAERFVDYERQRGQTYTLTTLRPQEPLYLNLMKFTSDDISRLIVQGYETGVRQLKTNPQ